MSRFAYAIVLIIVPLVCLVVAIAPGTEVASESPFGVVCPWPGMQRAGIRWCRVGAGATEFVNWPSIQKSPGTWDWSAADNELKQLADPLGLSLLPICGYTPKWASRMPEAADYQFHPPRDVASYAEFVRQCVARYKNRVKVWEVWNEPNIGFFRGSAAEYAEMVKAAAVAAKQEDPDCRIAMGCAGVDLDFLRRLYEFGCGPYFDVMSVHPYRWGRQLNDGWMIEKLQGCRRLMDEHGDKHKEIWITEFGWSLSEGVTPQEQADLLVQAMVTALSLRERLKVEKLFWFCVKDWGGPGHGLFDVAGQPKPVLIAYQAVTTELAQARYRGLWNGPAGVRGHVFDRPAGPVLVVWNPSVDGKSRIELKTAAAKLSLRTVANRTSELAVIASRAAVDVGHAPVFITGMEMSDLAFTPSAADAVSRPPPARGKLAGVWLSILPPATTARPYLVFGSHNQLPLRVHNTGTELAKGELNIELIGPHNTLASGRLAFEVGPRSLQIVVWHVTLPSNSELVGELARLRVTGLARNHALPAIDVPIRLTRGKAIEFAANSFVEQQYLYKAEKSGCSDSVRFGSEFGYRFDTRGIQSAQLRIDVGANGANPWSVLVAKGPNDYVVERSGKSWPSWQTLSLDTHRSANGAGAGNVYVKIRGTDCQVREIVFEAETSQAECGKEAGLLK